MTSTRIRNTATADSPRNPPRRPDGSLFPFEVIYGGDGWRGYADTHEEIIDLVIPGYTDLAADDRLRARIRAAIDVQVALQAGLAAAADDELEACTEPQRSVLLGHRDTPPILESWDAPIPLVLVTTFYQPQGPHPLPVADNGAQIWWLDPDTDSSLLETLNVTGWITLNRAVPEKPEPASRPGGDSDGA